MARVTDTHGRALDLGSLETDSEMETCCFLRGTFRDSTWKKVKVAGLGRGKSWAEKQLLEKLSWSHELLESWDSLSKMSQIVYRDWSPDTGGSHKVGGLI